MALPTCGLVISIENVVDDSLYVAKFLCDRDCEEAYVFQSQAEAIIVEKKIHFNVDIVEVVDPLSAVVEDTA